jgi:hypothetical protein
MHLSDSPFHYIAEVFVVDIKVLPAHRTLCPFFEFVLTVTNKENRSDPISTDSRVRKARAHDFINPSLSRFAMILLSSLTCNPTLPAKSSSLSLDNWIIGIK